MAAHGVGAARVVSATAIGWASLVLLVSFLLSPPLVYAALLERGQKLDALYWWNVGMSFLWIAVLHAMVRRPFRLHLFLAPLYVTTAADLFVVLHFRARLTTTYLSIAIADFGDVGEFVRSFGWSMLALLALITPVYALGLRGVRHVGIACSRAWRWVGAALILTSYGGAAVRQTRVLGISPASACVDAFAHDYSSPMGALSQVALTVATNWRVDEHLEERRAFSFGAHKRYVLDDEIYVLVIGESSRPDHWSINGYRRDTTPRLRQTRNIIVLDDVVATAPYTGASVPYLMSLAPVDDRVAVEAQRSIVSAFREVGFETFWFSAQEVSQWGGIIHNIAKEAGALRYAERKLDNVLVDELRGAVAGTPKRAFIVLHTKGSHFEFSSRYPPDFRMYPDAGGTRVEDLVNAYDNSVLYTDWILSQVIEVLQARRGPALLVYASDHGENLLDDDQQLFGHAIGNKYDLSTAAFVWYSDAFAARFPREIAAARSHASAALSLANLPHSILDIAGIDARGLDRSKSIFGETFRASPRVYFSKGKTQVYALESPRASRTARAAAQTTAVAPLPLTR